MNAADDGTRIGTGSIEAPRVGYVLKVFPRLSQTFILRELLAHQAAGARIDVFSLRPPKDSIVHTDVARLRHEVTYLDADDSSDAGESWEAAGGSLRRYRRWRARHDGREPTVIAAALELAVAVRVRRIDHLHAHFAKLPTTVARLAAELSGVSYSFTAHARDIFHRSVDVGELATSLRDAAFVVTVSEFNRAHLRRLAPTANVHRILNGVDLSQLDFSAGPRRERRLLGVGRFVAKKGFDDLIEACGRLSEDGVAFRCDLIGSGPLEHELRARVRRLGLDDRVRFRGALPQDRVVEAIRSASALAAPCVVSADGDRDGLPTVLIEAMAVGTPCISTPVTGIPEIVQPGLTGLLVPPRDPGALAGGLRRLLDDESLRHDLGAAARTLIERDFDLVRNVGRLRELFDWAVATRKLRLDAESVQR